MEAILKLVQFGPTTEGQSEKGPWRKGIVIFETSGEYPKKIAIGFFNAKLEEATKFNEGDMCKVDFTIASREFNGKFYTDVTGNSIEAVGQKSTPVQQATPEQKPQQQPQPQQGEFFDKDDLPF